jgi:hypothetical protein
MKKGEISIYHSIITLNVNHLNSPIKRHRLAEWIKKQNKKNKIQLLAVCKTLNSLAKTHTE